MLFRKLSLFLCCLLVSSYLIAKQTNIYFPYAANSRYILLDRSGQIVSPQNNEGDITYSNGYWIVQLPTDIPIGNIAEANDFRYSFTKTGNILTFKLKDSLTYLGEERLAYTYKDSHLSVLLDTDGNLISPENTYFTRIDKFIDGFALVVINGQKGYINKNGEFLTTEQAQKIKPASEIANNTIHTDRHCKPLTAENVLYLCEKNNVISLTNAETGTIATMGKDVTTVNYYHTGDEQLPSDKFWLSNYVNGYRVYQLYNSEGNLLYENQFSHVSPFFGNIGWVRPHNKDYYQLINSKGKAISGQYNSIQVKAFGDKVITYAYRKMDADSNKSLMTLFDEQGEIVFYEDYINQWQDNDCRGEIKILKNRLGDVVWPADIETTCLLQNYVRTAIKDPMGWSFEQERADKSPRIPQEKIQLAAEKFLDARILSAKNRFSSLSNGRYLVGPQKITLDNIAELALPEGYVYFENENNNNRDCQRYIMPAYATSGRMCLYVEQIGYINLPAEKMYFDTYANEVKNQFINQVEPFGKKNNFSFDWLVAPTLDYDTHSMQFAYKYAYAYITRDYVQEVYVDHKMVNIKFTNQHMILLVNEQWWDAAILQDNIIDWGKQITVLSPHEYNPVTAFPCGELPAGDSALSRAHYDYLGENRCFPVQLSYLIMNRDNQISSQIDKLLWKTKSQQYHYSPNKY